MLESLMFGLMLLSAIYFLYLDYGLSFYRMVAKGTRYTKLTLLSLKRRLEPAIAKDLDGLLAILELQLSF